jgi:hypothetical protein
MAMLVKSGTGSFSLVGGMVMSVPQPQQQHGQPPSKPLLDLLHQLMRRLQ